MLRIGITGGIGSGKSIVSRLFQILEVPVYDSDLRAKWLMANDLELAAELAATFGPDTFDAATGELNRTYLARTVFTEPTRLAILNALVHPHVGRDFEQWAETHRQAAQPYVLKEAALLYESGAYRQLDHVITVAAPLAVRQARVLRRDPHRTAEDILNIVSKQMSEEEKIQRADYVIYNDDEHLLIPQVLELDRKFRKA